MALPVTSFVIERLLEFDPSFDTGGGIATTALMINPLSVILQPLRDELDEIQNNQSILTVLEADAPDGFDEDIVDALASNVFIERNTGGKSSGTVRVRYFSPQDIDIGTGLASFLDTANNRYINVNPISMTSSEMSLNVEGSLYYIDIPVESEEEGSAGNVDVGGIQVFENEPANIANVTNPAKFSSGTDRETNTELIDRIKVAVTVRALVTGRGIITTLTDNFSSIEEINTRGFGDPEMQRDIVYNVHIGGNVDIWVKVPEFINTTQDFVSVVADTTRRDSGRSSMVMRKYAPDDYTLLHRGLDRTNTPPVIGSSDGYVTYIEGVDYNIDDIAGTIERISAGSIFHLTGTTGAATAEGITTNKTLVDATGPFVNVRPGMQVTIVSPSSAAGNYSVKAVSATQITIFNEFPFASVGLGGVEWEVNDVVVAVYEFNPIAIDVIKSDRSDSRDGLTISNVPLMKVNSVEVLDPQTLQPTGTFLDSTGGWGQGPFGQGPFGIGTPPDYTLQVFTPNLRYSEDESNFIRFSGNYLGYNLRVDYDYASEIATYQAFVDDPQNNVEVAKLIVKHFIPAYVSSISPIVYYVSASNTSSLSEAEVQAAIETLIDETPIRTNLELSDIVDLLYNSGADRVDLSFSLQAQVHNTDGTMEFFGSDSDGILEIPDRTVGLTGLPDTDKPLSKEIAHYIPDAVVLTRVTT